MRCSANQLVHMQTAGLTGCGDSTWKKKTPWAGRPWPVGVPSGGLVPFVLFSDLLATDEREQLAEKLCSYPPPSQPLQPHRYTAADARLPRYDARHKTFWLYWWTQLHALRSTGSQLLTSRSKLGLRFFWPSGMTAQTIHRPGHGTVETSNDIDERGSSCWRASLSFWRRTNWNAHGYFKVLKIAAENTPISAILPWTRSEETS